MGDRLGWLLLGMGVGFVLGYIVARLREIKEEVDEIDIIVKGQLDPQAPDTKKNQRGAFSLNLVAVPLVVLITAFAAFSAARVNTQLHHTLDCLTQYNTRQGTALSTRDDAIKQGTASEIELWTQYGELYSAAKKDPSKIPEVQEKLAQAVQAHRSALLDTQEIRSANPYADPNVLKDCKEKS